MAKLAIVWTTEAEEQKKEILAYWFYRNKSINFPIKLEIEVAAELNFLASNPSIKKKLHKDLYYLRVRNYWILYKKEALSLYILAFLDARQNPQNLNLP